MGHFPIFIFVYKFATPSTIFTPTDVNFSPHQSDKYAFFSTFRQPIINRNPILHRYATIKQVVCNFF